VNSGAPKVQELHDQLLKKLMKYVGCKINASFAIGNAHILQQQQQQKQQKIENY